MGITELDKQLKKLDFPINRYQIMAYFSVMFFRGKHNFNVQESRKRQKRRTFNKGTGARSKHRRESS